MKKYAQRAVVLRMASLMAVVLMVLGPGVAEQSEAGGLKLSVSRSEVPIGKPFAVRASYTAKCIWLVEWDGLRRTSNAKAIATTFRAPKVTRRTTLPVRVTCFVTPAGRRGRARQLKRLDSLARDPARPRTDRQSLVARVPLSLRETLVVTVLGPGSVSPPHHGGHGQGPGGLPGTGGPKFALVLLGIDLILFGLLAIVTAKIKRRGPTRPSTG